MLIRFNILHCCRPHRRERVERLEPDPQNIFLLRRTLFIRGRPGDFAIDVNVLLGQRALLDIRIGYRDLRRHHCNSYGRHAGHGAAHKLVRHLAVRQRHPSAARPAHLLVDLRADPWLPADFPRPRLVPSRRIVALVLHAVRYATKEDTSSCRRR